MIDNTFLHTANRLIHKTLLDLRPKLLAAQGSIAHELKSDNSVVTEMDIMVEKHLRTVLHKLDPTIGFCGEETGIDYAHKKFWLVDPIDGTEWFIRGMPFATNMVSLIVDGQTVLGIIYNFSLDEYYLAIKGEGATCNGAPIHVANRSFERSMVMLSHMPNLPMFIHNLHADVAGRPKFNASGFEAAAVACGKMDGMIRRGKKGAWDFTAGNLLITEAGGRVENFHSSTYDFRDLDFVAASPAIFDILKQRIEAVVPPAAAK